MTGHIDLLQLRNGALHILDYKPQAHKEKPIEQLTLYALALSRLTGLRLFHMKCAWFDEQRYFEFRGIPGTQYLIPWNSGNSGIPGTQYLIPDATSLDYARLSAVLVEAVKAQQAQLEALKAEVEVLKVRQ